MKAVRGLTGGKEGQQSEHGLGGLNGIVWAAMQWGGQKPEFKCEALPLLLFLII